MGSEVGLYYHDGSSPRTLCRGWLHVLCAATAPIWGGLLLRRSVFG
jgi:hypothetical protein